MTPLHCQMEKTCSAPIAMLDEKGYVYCTEHGRERRLHGTRTRKLRPHELNRLARGQQVARY